MRFPHLFVAIVVIVALATAAMACGRCGGDSAEAGRRGADATHIAAERDPRCGPDAIVVDVDGRGVCIDAYESPGFDRVPARVDFAEAARACQRRGFRLCTEREWELACRGPRGLRYPYGNLYDASTCNTERPTPVEAGSRAACRGDSGTYDMSGNAAEWVRGRFLKGGDHTATDVEARCGARFRATDLSAPSYRGFRCCKDLRDELDTGSDER